MGKAIKPFVNSLRAPVQCTEATTSARVGVFTPWFIQLIENYVCSVFSGGFMNEIMLVLSLRLNKNGEMTHGVVQFKSSSCFYGKYIQYRYD